MKKGIVDRFEGQYAVIEFDDEIKDIPLKELPKGVKVGDVLLFDDDKVIIDKGETERLRKEIEDLMDELFED